MSGAIARYGKYIDDAYLGTPRAFTIRLGEGVRIDENLFYKSNYTTLTVI